MHVREYGSSGPLVFILHGGPAACGDVAPVAKALSDAFRTIEPWQRGSGDERLSVERHVHDVHELVSARGRGLRPAIVGHSWGAMLALCYAAAHPIEVGPIVLVGSGTFDVEARRRMQEILAARTTPTLAEQIARALETAREDGDRFMRKHKLTRDLSVYDRAEPWPDQDEYEPFDIRAHSETWQDMMRLQEDGTYPRAFAAIETPVLMLHGAYDPHPGSMIRESLLPHIPELDYRELERCGHSPWLERQARDRFFSILRDWLAAKSSR